VCYSWPLIRQLWFFKGGLVESGTWQKFLRFCRVRSKNSPNRVTLGALTSQRFLFATWIRGSPLMEKWKKLYWMDHNAGRIWWNRSSMKEKEREVEAWKAGDLLREDFFYPIIFSGDPFISSQDKVRNDSLYLFFRLKIYLCTFKKIHLTWKNIKLMFFNIFLIILMCKY
jgi:hypothetical protein